MFKFFKKEKSITETDKTVNAMNILLEVADNPKTSTLKFIDEDGRRLYIVGAYGGQPNYMGHYECDVVLSYESTI